MKFIDKMKSRRGTIALIIAAASIGAAVPATAQTAGTTTITIGNQYGVSAVGDRTDDYATALDTGQHVDQATAPARFQGASACIVFGGNSWSLRRDGTLDPRRSAPVCAPIVNGVASISLNGSVPDGSTFIIRYAGGGFDWAGQDRIRVTRT